MISGHLPPTVELNALAMKRGEATVYTFSQAPPAPIQFVPQGYGNFARMIAPRYPTYNRGFQSQQQGLYVVTLKVRHCFNEKTSRLFILLEFRFSTLF